jgi:AhpD family alkylhydroperoxidase
LIRRRQYLSRTLSDGVFTYLQCHICHLVQNTPGTYSLDIASNLFKIVRVVLEDEMSEHYHDVGDLRFLKEMGKLAPTEFNAWLALDKIVGREDGAIPRKYRELIALGVAFTTQCPYCIEVHVKAAKAAGASREEVTESSLIAAALRAGGAATHGAMALKFYDQL